MSGSATPWGDEPLARPVLSEVTAFSGQVFDVVTSLIKAAVFAGLISAIGCQRGFQVRAGAQDVGKFTTSAVVAAIFLIVLADSIFAVMLYYVKRYGIF